MGDVAMTVPVIKRVTERFPDLKITFLTRRFFAPLFEELPNVQVYEAEVHDRHKGVAGLRRLSHELQELGIDAVADLHNVLRSNILKVFFQMANVPVKQINKGRAEKKALTRKNNKLLKPLKTTHERYAEVFAKLGFPIDLSEPVFLPRQKISRTVKELAGEEPRKWLGIAPFAQHESKVYPGDLMQEVLLKLEKEENLKVFLFGGGAKECGILKNWEQQYSNAVSLAGKVSFAEEVAFISNLDAMLAMDSGNGHMAANFGVPVITMFGLTHPFTGFAPFGQPSSNWILPDLEKYPAIPTSIYGKNIPGGYEEVMRSIPPQTVVQKVKEVLSL